MLLAQAIAKINENYHIQTKNTILIVKKLQSTNIIDKYRLLNYISNSFILVYIKFV